MVAWLDIRRSKLRFGLLTGSVALLVFLVVFLAALSGGLIGAVTGAIAGLNAPVITYSDTARGNIQGSRLAPRVVDEVRAIPGVQAAGPVGVGIARAELPGEGMTDVQVFAYQPSQPGGPTTIAAGQVPTQSGQAVMDASGIEVGDTVVLEPGAISVTVTATAINAQFSALPTVYIPWTDFEALVRAINPTAPVVPVNAVAVIADGTADEVVAQRITDAAIGAEGFTQSQAVAAIPGVESIRQTFGLLVGIAFAVSVVVIGFFFLILTVQKLRTFTLLRAVGASTAMLARSVIAQITIVVAVAGVIGAGLAVAALEGIASGGGLPVSVEPVTVAVIVGAVWLFSVAAGLLSIRRIRAIDPATAAGAR